MSAGECTLPCKRMNRHYMPSPMDQFVWVYASLYLVNVQFIYHLLHTECFSINWIRSFFCESIFRISWSLYREIGYLQIQNIFIVTKRVPENCAKRCTFTLYIRREREYKQTEQIPVVKNIEFHCFLINVNYYCLVCLLTYIKEGD